MKKYSRLETEFLTKAATRPRPRPRPSPPAWPAGPVLAQPLHTLSRSAPPVELARILFSDSDTLLLDEPTNHLDADSIIWLRDYLKSYRGGFIVISHDIELVETVVNKVFYLDANRTCIDVYNMAGSFTSSSVRRTRAPQARAANAEKKASQLNSQRQDAGEGDQDRGRAEHGAPGREIALGLEAVRQSDRVAKLRSRIPRPAARPR
ncbi:ABC-F family ATP-binding cassette domain-containing protein [Streptacidiphilus sp. 4-A2]|nr:ABC-F family ATP-binding cassette domain-containing protein [Streptacidiphilus sp. 4-A2]